MHCEMALLSFSTCMEGNLLKSKGKYVKKTVQLSLGFGVVVSLRYGRGADIPALLPCACLLLKYFGQE